MFTLELDCTSKRAIGATTSIAHIAHFEHFASLCITRLVRAGEEWRHVGGYEASLGRLCESVKAFEEMEGQAGIPATRFAGVGWGIRIEWDKFRFRVCGNGVTCRT